MESSENSNELPPAAQSVLETNAQLIQRLDELVRETPQQRAALYDFWGRGNLAKLLRNARSFKDSFNITLEVRSLDDVRAAVRLWSLYTDLLILLWKGPTENGKVIAFIEEDYDQAGGWGHMMALGDKFKAEGSDKTFRAAIGFASLLPDDLVAFLFTEARSLLLAGKLLIIPATGVGCVHPGHGPMEYLLAETANAIPVLRTRSGRQTPIGLLPYSPNSPMDVLADLVHLEAEPLRKLRLLLMRRTCELGDRQGENTSRRELALQIDDALRDLTNATSSMAREVGLATTSERLHGMPGPRSTRPNAHEIADGKTESLPFKALLALKSMGYGWAVGSLSSQSQGVWYQPEAGDVLGAWLAPWEPGWTIPTVVMGDGDA